jgi:hypothetical protein
VARLTLRSRSIVAWVRASITCLGEDNSPHITPSPSRTATTPPRRHGRRQLLGRLRRPGQPEEVAIAAGYQGTALNGHGFRRLAGA